MFAFPGLLGSVYNISFSHVLRAQGYDDQILRVIKSIYEDVKSKIIINGHCWGPGDFPNRKQDFTHTLCSLLSAIIKIADLSSRHLKKSHSNNNSQPRLTPRGRLLE